MKNKENIEYWEGLKTEELLSMANSSKVEVPDLLSERLDTLFMDLEEQEKSKARKNNKIGIYASIGLVAASLAAVLILHTSVAQPKDTFTSPQEAYAMLESTFSHIASKTGAATQSLSNEIQRAEDTIIDIYR